MARGRMLNQSIATDKRLNELSMEAQFVYMMAIPHLDRDGIVIGDPIVLWAQVCPRRQELMPKIAGIIAEWAAAGLVVVYETSEGDALWFPSFRRNQVGMRYDREPASTFAPPPGHYRTDLGLEAIPTEPPASQLPEDEQHEPQQSAGSVPTSSADDCRKSAGSLPESIPPNRIEVEVEGETGARTCETIRNDEKLSPQSLTGDFFMDAAVRRFEGQRYQNRRWQSIDGMKRKLGKFELTVEQFTQMVNAHLKHRGTQTLADGDGDAADRELNEAQQFVLSLCSTGRRFWSVDGIDMVWQSWQTNDRRPNPSNQQLLQHASQVVEGKIGGEAVQAEPTYKRMKQL